jgi:hypothetical protein
VAAQQSLGPLHSPPKICRDFIEDQTPHFMAVLLSLMCAAISERAPPAGPIPSPNDSVHVKHQARALKFRII